MSEIIVIGGGEFAAVVIEAIEAGAIETVLGFVDPRPASQTVASHVAKHLGDDTELQNYPNAKLVLGVGSTTASEARRFIVRSLGYPDSRWTSVRHPDALVSHSAQLEHGSIILAGAIVCRNARIEQHAIINLGATIDHDVVVGEYTHVCPGAVMGGASSIGPNSLIGINASIRDHTHCGANTTVGMGAVVTQNYDGGLTLIGTPAKPIAVQLRRAL